MPTDRPLPHRPADPAVAMPRHATVLRLSRAGHPDQVRHPRSLHPHPGHRGIRLRHHLARPELEASELIGQLEGIPRITGGDKILEILSEAKLPVVREEEEKKQLPRPRLLKPSEAKVRQSPALLLPIATPKVSIQTLPSIPALPVLSEGEETFEIPLSHLPKLGEELVPALDKRGVTRPESKAESRGLLVGNPV